MSNLLYDRFVDLTMEYDPAMDLEATTKPKSLRTVKIVTPATGRKPDIKISGSIIPSNVVASMNVRIVNFNSSIPLGAYNSITVQAGYRNGVTTKISGALNNKSVGWAYQESPSPDGITNFTLMLGNFDNWVNKTGEFHSDASTTLKVKDIFDIFCSNMGITPEYGEGIDTLTWNMETNFGPGPIKDFLMEIASKKQFAIQLNGNVLRCFFLKTGMGKSKAKNISYLSTPPRIDTTATMSFVGPWRPDLLPGDVIRIDPKYAKMTFAGSLDTPKTYFTIMTLDFDFSTTDGTNSMKVEALAFTTGDDVKKELGVE